MFSSWWKPKVLMWITQKCVLETDNGKKEANNDLKQTNKKLGVWLLFRKKKKKTVDFNTYI